MSSFLDVKGEIKPNPTPSTPSNVMDMFSMKGKVVAISGAGAGIGFAVAEAMAEAGAHVAIWYNSNKAAVQKAEELAKKNGVKAKAYQCGVTDYEAVHATVAQVVKDFGHLDCFVANSGVAFAGGILEQPVEEWHKVMDVNLHGVFYCAKACGEVFKQQGKGNLIITASMSGQIVNVPTDQGCYNTSKAAVIHLARSLAREWRDFARVNTVSPGYIETDLGAAPKVRNEAFRMAVQGRQGDVKELKGAYLYLASDASTYCTGHDLVVDGGYTLP
ncbi:NAD(P)-binding protein [Jaminaea rosea]|uniref:NAD(P)-binding protein n=1 Tax=Jaminaea rosea TaxID=1569628 RepID=A0A316UP11_9BASI|nr:NAD(P)-binding protein [Jaminaea rosea]PWN27042.1 NAD(P)-binding protein [Jaminaea rosea]